ncbi:cyclase family protein [Thermus sp.]|uniref:cyclase family protein n=1 Tax=Thermus sp. TaxID=275 RepID=UPI00307ED46E
MCAPLVMDAVARSLSRRAFLGVGLGLLASQALAQAEVPGKAFRHAVDLTHELSPEIPLFPGAEPMRITTLVTVRQNGYYGNRLDLWEHSGTHMDAPAHFAEGGLTAEKLPVGNLIAPLAVVHIHEKAAKDPDAQVTVDDLLAYERRYGRLPKGALVAMHSGWEARWQDPKAFLNQDASGVLHFPGFSPEAVAFLVEEREIVGVGVDTLSLDFGPSKDFKAHLTLLGAGKYGLENLANLAQVPPAGALILVGGPKHRGASGGPVRALAVW